MTFVALRDEERIRQIEETLLKGMEMDGQPKGAKTAKIIQITRALLGITPPNTALK